MSICDTTDTSAAGGVWSDPEVIPSTTLPISISSLSLMRSLRSSPRSLCLLLLCTSATVWARALATARRLELSCSTDSEPLLGVAPEGVASSDGLGTTGIWLALLVEVLLASPLMLGRSDEERVVVSLVTAFFADFSSSYNFLSSSIRPCLSADIQRKEV